MMPVSCLKKNLKFELIWIVFLLKVSKVQFLKHLNCCTTSTPAMTISRKARNRTKRPSDLCKVSSKASIHSSVVFIATFLFSIFPYLLTVSPSIAGGDSGELLAEGCNLGTSHPPGYPLYTILVFALKTSIVNRSTFSVAFTVNLSSCFFGAMSSAFLSSSILLLLRGKRSKNFRKKYRDEAINTIAAITMGLCNSYSPLTWQYSTTAEVFALHNLLVSIILYSSVKFALDPSVTNFRCGAFFCGLALTNQHTSILLSLPIGAWVFYTLRAMLSWESLLLVYDPRKWIVVEKGTPIHLIRIGAGAFLSSFVVLYGTLPFFAYISPHAGSWGNVVSVRGFLNHFLRRDYGSLQLYSGDDTLSEGMVSRIFLWCWDFVLVQSNPFVGGCVLVGCKEVIMREYTRQTAKIQFTSKRATARSSSSQKTLSSDGIGVDMAILVSLVFYLVVFHSLANLPLNNDLFFGIHQRFWLHPNLLSFLIAGLGLANVMKKWVMIWPQQLRVILFLPLVIISFVGLRGVSVNNQSDNYHFRNYAVSILSTLPENATLYINFDQTWTSIRYMQECEGMRRDVTSLHLGMMSYDWWETKIPLYPDMTFPGKQYVQGNTPKWQNGGFTFSELLDANSDTSNGIFIAGKPSFPDPAYTHKFEEVSHGIVSEIVKKNEVSMSSEKFRVDSQDTWNQVLKQYATSGLPAKSKYDQVTWESTIVREFYDHFVSRATYLLDLAVKENASGTGNGLVVPSLAEACAWLELAMINDESSAQSPALWKNLGLGYLHLVKSKETNIPILSDLLDPNATSFLDVDMQVWWDGDSDWKTWASNRWQIAWSHYLGMKEAKSDESYASVKSLYDAVMQATNQK